MSHRHNEKKPCPRCGCEDPEDYTRFHPIMQKVLKYTAGETVVFEDSQEEREAIQCLAEMIIAEEVYLSDEWRRLEKRKVLTIHYANHAYLEAYRRLLVLHKDASYDPLMDMEHGKDTEIRYVAYDMADNVFRYKTH